MTETFLTSPLKLLNGIQRILAGSKISASVNKFAFFLSIKKTRWRPKLLIGWDIFNFSAETAARSSMTLDKKQDPNVLYQVCIFQTDRKNKMATRPFIAETCSTSLLKPPNGIKRNLAGSKIQVCVLGPIGKDCRAGLWLAETFEPSPLKPLNRIQRKLKRCKILTSFTKFGLFGDNRIIKIAAGSLICWDMFDFSTTAERNSTRLDRKQDLNNIYQICVLRTDRKTNMAA